MDEFTQNQAEEYFADTTVLLAGGRHQKPDGSWVFDETELHVNFYFCEPNVRVSVYNSEISEYLAEYNGTSVQSISEAFQLAAEVAKGESNQEALRMIPALERKVSEFLQYLPDAFSVFSDLQENPDWNSRYCETCGVSSDELSAYVFPATDKLPASMSLHWEYGCYGGTHISGGFDEVKDEVVRVLNSAIEGAVGEPKELFRDFLHRVESFQP